MIKVSSTLKKVSIHDPNLPSIYLVLHLINFNLIFLSKYFIFIKVKERIFEWCGLYCWYLGR